MMKLHGVEKEIRGLFCIADQKLKTSADFEIKSSDFNLDIPSYMGIEVADIVNNHISFNHITSKETKK